MTDKITLATARPLSAVKTGVLVKQFDAVDTKGRRFGARVALFSAEWVACDVTLWNLPHNIAGVAERAAFAGKTRYSFVPHATRDGDPFGACQAAREFATAAERDAAVEKYFATAERGALKNKARAR